MQTVCGRASERLQPAETRSVAEWVHLQGPSALAEASGEAPSAHVHDFADASKGKVTGPSRKRTSQKVSPTLAGCDSHYGTANVCVPTTFPAEVKKTTASRCEWLKENNHGRPKANGKDDPLRLDHNRDGLACGKGDVKRR